MSRLPRTALCTRHLIVCGTAALLSLAGCASDGMDGMDGANGHDGANGANGHDGANGANGHDGANGANGHDGADGTDGQSVGAGIVMRQLGRYETGKFKVSAAEIVDVDPLSKRAFVVNAQASRIDVLDVTDPATPTVAGSIDVAPALPGHTLGAANSVSIFGGVVAVAIEANPKTDPGVVAFYDTRTLALLSAVEVGALPDMLTFTPDGRRVLTADEGEPKTDYTIDPEGSVSIIDVSAGFAHPTVTRATFTSFNAKVDDLRAAGVRIFGLNATVAQDVEPEYVAVSADSKTAWVTLQENNALAIVDIATATVRDVVPLGFKDHSIPSNELDPSDKDGGIKIRTMPIFGMYQPDAIAAYDVAGQTYLVTANEGDARDYTGLKEEVRVSTLTLDPAAFPNAADLKLDANLGRLNVTNKLGDTNGDGTFKRLYAFGGRSFSIWTAAGKQVFDSGNDLEVRTALRLGQRYNADNEANGGDNRSDNKGPEPEGLDVGVIDGRTYVFLGLERVGGIAIYDITLPESPRFIQYLNNRDLSITFNGNDPAQLSAAGDLGPEGVHFVPAAESPTGTPMLAVGNEVSGSTTFYEIRTVPAT